MQTSIIPLSETQVAGRLDAEYLVGKLDTSIFDNYIYLEQAIVKEPQYGAPYASEPRLSKQQPRYVRITDLDSWNTLDSSIGVTANGTISSYILHKNDILFARSGETVGKLYLHLEDPRDIHFYAGYMIRFVLDTNKLLPSYLFAYGLTSYYQSWKQSVRRPTGQPNINAQEYCKLPIPLFSPDFQKSIEGMVLEAHAQRETANRLSAEAQELLEKELGLFNWQPPKPRINVSVRPYSQTLQAKRIDAEYYQQRYEAIINKLKAYKGGVRALGSFNAIYSTLTSPKQDVAYQYMELASIDASGSVSSPSDMLGQELPSRARRLVKNEDVIISTVEGSLNKSALILDNASNLICSTGFAVINQNSFVNSETLFCYFRIPHIMSLLAQQCRGTILTAFDNTSLEKFLIPIIRQETQNEIAQKVQQAHAARQKAKGLLQQAKEAVERAIEKGE